MHINRLYDTEDYKPDEQLFDRKRVQQYKVELTRCEQDDERELFEQYGVRVK